MWLSHFTKSSLYKSLNTKQQEAVSLPYNENGLIVAGAGSGKTKTLITRICALAQTEVFAPSEIVALTFTNKAAKEMKHRLEDSLQEISEQIFVGTFHSFALNIIKKYPEKFGLKHGFKLLNETQQVDFARNLFVSRNWSLKNNSVNVFLGFVNDQKEKGKRSSELTIKNTGFGRGSKAMIEKYQEYELTLKQQNKIDFSDLLLLINELIKKDPVFLNFLKNTYKVYLVDEFQDTNPIQYETLLLLTGQKEVNYSQEIIDNLEKLKLLKEKELQKLNEFPYSSNEENNKKQYAENSNNEIDNLKEKKENVDLKYLKDFEVDFDLNKMLNQKGAIFAVGDDSQSIYSFRGAVVKNIFEFKDDLVGNNFVKLEQNYRSSGNIVSLSNQFIEKSLERIDKTLWTNNPAGSDIYVYQSFNEKEEAKFVVNKILDLKRAYGVHNNQISILYRGNAQSAKIETLLALHGLPCRVSGGMNFLKQSEIKLLISCAKILIDVNYANDFINVLLKVKGINHDKETLEKWIIEAQEEKIEFSELLVRKSYSNPSIKHLFNEIAESQDYFRFNLMKTSFDYYLDKIGFYYYLSEQKNSEQRLENVKTFLKEIEDFEKNGGRNFSAFIYSLEATLNFEYFEQQEINNEFISDDLVELEKESILKSQLSFDDKYQESLVDKINHLEQMKSQLGLNKGKKIKKKKTVSSNNISIKDNVITLQTIHSSKGLEYDYVFVLGLEDGVIPSAHAIEENNIEEERRLLYVALTRAKKELYLTYCLNRFNGFELVSYPPTRFFKDFNLDFLFLINLKEQDLFKTAEEIQIEQRNNKEILKYELAVDNSPNLFKNKEEGEINSKVLTNKTKSLNSFVKNYYNQEFDLDSHSTSSNSYAETDFENEKTKNIDPTLTNKTSNTHNLNTKSAKKTNNNLLNKYKSLLLNQEENSDEENKPIIPSQTTKSKNILSKLKSRYNSETED